MKIKYLQYDCTSTVKQWEKNWGSTRLDLLEWVHVIAMAMQSEQGDYFTNDLQLSAWWLITFLSCLEHFTKLFTKYLQMSLILPQVINWF